MLVIGLVVAISLAQAAKGLRRTARVRLHLMRHAVVVEAIEARSTLPMQSWATGERWTLRSDRPKRTVTLSASV